MSGLATAAIITSVLAAGATIYSGEKASSASKKGRRLQEQVQRTSLLAALREEKLAGQAENRANRRKPDVASLLFDAGRRGNMGAASTILAGAGGKGSALLGSKSTLGG